MAVQITGKIVKVERRTFTRKDGTEAETFDAFVQDDPVYRAKRVSGPIELLPEVGAEVSWRAIVKAMSGKLGPWLSVWVISDAAAPA